MKVFCSFAYTGENESEVRVRMVALKQLFDRHGVAFYCDLFDDDFVTFIEPREFILDALYKFRSYDTLLVVNTSERRSEGMLIEVGAALERGVPITYAQHVSSLDKTCMPSLAQEVFVWDTEESLLTQVEAWLKRADIDG